MISDELNSTYQISSKLKITPNATAKKKKHLPSLSHICKGLLLQKNWNHNAKIQYLNHNKHGKLKYETNKPKQNIPKTV